jgi:PIN domain nuclease of toxin-antitoxin system
MDEVQRIGIMLLPIKDEYLNNYNNIPLFENHRDPFDRLILATAFTEKLQIFLLMINLNYIGMLLM